MNNIILKIQNDLDSIKKQDKDFEYWSARELMLILGYIKWQKFVEVIEKAKEACKTSGYIVADHFTHAGKMVLTGSGAQRQIEDILLTRYACYLIAQNGDPRKPQIALSQTYFASQTRRQELLEQREYEDKRLETRNKLKETENKIERTIYERGIRLPVEFATFKNRHIEALYGGISTLDLRKKRNIPKGRALADFDTHVELKAKDFSLAMTDHNIKEKNLRGMPQLSNEVIENGKATRRTLLSRGIVPENLKPEEDLKKIEYKRRKEIKEISKKSRNLELK
jgi:DNA-damage-inducible protein D